MSEINHNTYFDAVNDAANEVRRLIIDESMDRDEAMHQVIDGSEWVFKYYHARHTLLYSNNEDALFDAGVQLEDLKLQSAGAIYCALAYYAMHADVSERFDELFTAEDN
jgi:hypothetical protein